MMLFMRIKFAHLSKTQKSKYVKNERLMFLQVRKFIHYAEVDIKTGIQKLQEIFMNVWLENTKKLQNQEQTFCST